MLQGGTERLTTATGQRLSARNLGTATLGETMLLLAQDRGPSGASRLGEAALTPRETEVLAHMGRGLRVSEVAARLGLAESTIASYIKNLYVKLNISSRAQAALEATRRGLA